MLEKRNIAICGGTILDGLGGLREKSTILVNDGRIKDIIKGEICPEGYECYPGEGRYIMPGLVEMHGHFYGRSTRKMKSQHQGYCPLFIAGGVTTVRTPGEFQPEITAKWKEDIENLKAIGPRILSAGSYFDRNPSIVNWIEGCDSIEEIQNKYDVWKDKIDFVKVYSNMPIEWISTLVNLAHNDELKIYGHLGISTAKDAILAGIDGLEHGIFTMAEFSRLNPKINEEILIDFDPKSKEATELIDLIVEKDIALTPTTIIFSLNSSKFKKDIEKHNLWQYLSEEGKENHRTILEEATCNNEENLRSDILLEKQCTFINRAYEAGARIFCGTDPAYPLATPGYAIVWEAEYMSLCGMNNRDIIKSLTSEAARELGLLDEIGSIQVGKIADIAILDKNPMESISNLETVVGVLKSGVLFEPEKLRKNAIGSLK